MNEQIKKIEKIYCDEKIIEQVVEKIEKYFDEINEILSDLIQIIFSKSWIKIPDKKYYFNHDIGAIFPDLNDFDCGRCSANYAFDNKTLQTNFAGFSGKLMTREEAKLLFLDKRSENPFLDDRGLVFSNNVEFAGITTANGMYTIYLINGVAYNFGDIGITSLHIPCYSLNIPENATKGHVLLILFKNDILPDKFKLVKLFEEEYIKIENDKVKWTQKLCDEVLQGKKLLDESFGEFFNNKSIVEDLDKNETVKLSDLLIALMQKKLLDCDKSRADIERYDEKILTDPNRGHWDLWDGEPGTQGNPVAVSLDFWARNPVFDIKEHGIVGIDFGTKSTVVVYQDGNDRTIPMRVGIGQYSAAPKKQHFENPTVVEFIDAGSFLSAYGSKIGRPDTLWEDTTVSHTAFNGMSQCNSKEYNAFFYELKQWAGDKKRSIRLQDKKNKDISLKPYLDTGDNDFDPIEIYAYYLGLYINNMHRKIHMDYILSFPVTYETTVRQRILKSFEKGLKKSLPSTLLNNVEIMKKFKITQGASEPAAYAVCALEEFNFDPIGAAKIFYGVFDFGGGTTDFDFGIWREANSTEPSEGRYDYVINHFGSGGDRYLGGENLLELLAFEVFKENHEGLRKEGIVFKRPSQCEEFIGDEVIVNDSQEAKLNIKQLADKLRPLWERHEGYEKMFESGSIKVNLSDKNGNQKVNHDLNINKEKLEKMIEDRIEKGVKNFFEALKLAFNFPQTKNIDSVKILLAGNSSKSPIVKKLFEKYIALETKAIENKNDSVKVLFEIYPPLGTIEAQEIKNKNSAVDNKTDDLTSPTGKTGVAFGLIKSRKGGKIKVEDGNLFESEIKFKYYIGKSKKQKFKVVLNRESKYNKWIWFIEANEELFELYYTDLPEASTNDLSTTAVSRVRYYITPSADETAGIYIRPVNPSVFEYVVATPSGISREKYLTDIVRIELI